MPEQWSLKRCNDDHTSSESMIISTLQFIHKWRANFKRSISNVVDNLSIFTGTMIMKRSISRRFRHNCWMFKRIPHSKYKEMASFWFDILTGSMIRIVKGILISIVCWLIYRVETRHLSSKPSLSTFLRNLALKIHASGAIYTWSFFRKWILCKFNSWWSNVWLISLDHAS